MADLTSRKGVAKAAREARLAERRRREVIAGIMGTAAGREWMLSRLEAAHVFASSFNTNALTMAFAEGERNTGLLDLNDIMAHCPDQYVLMMQERNARDASRRADDDTDANSTGPANQHRGGAQPRRVAEGPIDDDFGSGAPNSAERTDIEQARRDLVQPGH